MRRTCYPHDPSFVYSRLKHARPVRAKTNTLVSAHTSERPSHASLVRFTLAGRTTHRSFADATVFSYDFALRFPELHRVSSPDHRVDCRK
ncbi:hypothetical protein L6164_021116 [Bauhinia variegata]|uniref:Uncharacterized protein n=1 Tax=Bauhinia variegata TaxID=167791 RepID=A0ACB9N0V0_BAUVA|nr:hypothetical protein L6164_021116 [Bauhinia variegata]